MVEGVKGEASEGVWGEVSDCVTGEVRWTGM